MTSPIAPTFSPQTTNNEQQTILKLQQSAQEFQALLLKQMFSTAQNALAPTSPGSSVWQEMLYQNFAEHMAQADALGLQNQLIESLKDKDSSLATFRR